MDNRSETETPESLGIAPVNYRGKICLELAIDRNNAQTLVDHTGEHQDYVRRQGIWAKSSVEQVERETGCLPGTTTQQAGAVDYVLKHPQALEELKVPVVLALPPVN